MRFEIHSKHTRSAASLILIALVGSGRATIVAFVPGKKRPFVAQFIRSGKDPLLIRAASISDPQMVNAIASGANIRLIRILVEHNSPGLLALAQRRQYNLEIRVLPRQAQEGSRGESPVMTRSKDGFIAIYSEPNWAPSSFKGKIEMTIEGGASWEGSPRVFYNFNRAFDRATPIEWTG